MSEFNEDEKKIYESLFEGKQNELSKEINFLQKTLKNSRSHSVEMGSFEDAMNYKKEEDKILTFRAKNMNKKIMAILAAAALILLAVFVGLNQNSDKPKNTIAENSDRKEIKVKVSFVAGDVKVKSSESDQGKKPAVGDVLSSNQTITTGDKASVDLQFANGSHLRVRANTEIILKKLYEDSNGRTEELFMKQGMLVATVSKEKKTDKFNIVTPTVLAGVRGTKFLVSVNPNKRKQDVTRVSVVEGSVAIYGMQNDEPVGEPIEIIEIKETAEEESPGGKLTKGSISNEDVRIIEGKEKETNENEIKTEEDLMNKYGRIEVITLDGNKTVNGVITSQNNDDTLTVHTVKGFIKINKNKVIDTNTKYKN